MVSVVFELSHRSESGSFYVSIQPTDTRWNDFGYNYHAMVHITLEADKPTLTLRSKVIPVQRFDGKIVELSSNLDSWLRTEIAASGKEWLDTQIDLVNQDFPRFITLLDGEAAYRQLAEVVGDQQVRTEILMKMNDLVLLRDQGLFDALTDSLMLTEQFQLGVMRSGSSYRALHRGQRYLFGNITPSTITDTRSGFSFQCPLLGFEGSPHTLSVRFVDNEILSDRIHCLVGRNGAGKSRLLREFILHLGNSIAQAERSTPFLDNFESTARGDSIEFVGKDYTQLIAITSDAENSFPSAVRSDSRFEYCLINLHRTEGKEGGTNISTRLLIELMRTSDHIGEESRWQIFRKALSGYIEISDLYLPLLDEATDKRVITFGGLKWVNAATLRTVGEQASLGLYGMIDLSREICFIREGKEVRPSSGERMYFRFALNLLSYIDTAYVLIVDEPETHLHPNLVCDFMNLLYEILTATQSIALIATHSAYVVREVPTHCAHVYSIDEERIPRESFVYLKTLGASIESISQAIFADSNAKKFHKQLINSMASEGKSIDELIEAYAGFVSPEMLSQVASLMHEKNSRGKAE